VAETYDNDDTWNVVADHVLRALQQDAVLMGELAIATWQQELPEDAAVFQANLLPAVAVETEGWQGATVEALTELVEHSYQVALAVVVTGGELGVVMADTKRYIARALQVLEQQHLPSKQLDGLPSAIEGAEPGSVRLDVSGATVLGEMLEGKGLRGLAQATVNVHLRVVVPTD
jgi:hydroxymethylpyrimidine/phosphomethylpyrimidine kinase